MFSVVPMILFDIYRVSIDLEIYKTMSDLYDRRLHHAYEIMIYHLPATIIQLFIQKCESFIDVM